MVRTCPLFLLLICALGAAACNPCAERCRVESNEIDSCLDDWGLQWDDFDAQNAKDFSEQCSATEDAWINSLSGEERAAETGACRDVVEALRLAEDCDRKWEVLTSYGSE